MTKRGKIREIKGDLIIILPDISAVCFGCMEAECKSKRSFINAINPKALPLAIGQTVEFRAPDVSILGQSVTALLPPVLGFILGFFLTRFLFPNTSEGAAVFMGVIKLFITAFIVYKLRKKFPAKEHPRYVEQIVNSH